MGFFNRKKVVVAGGTGLIGRHLSDKLIEEGAKVRIVSLDDSSRAHPEAEFLKLDLRNYENCLIACNNMEVVFNLLCVKGSPKNAKEKPARAFIPMILFNTNLMEAAFRSGAERFLYASSLAVYPPAEIFKEDSVWHDFPSQNDWFPGWAKRVGELQADVYKKEYGWDKVSIVRPANTYGPYDDFSPEFGMVVPSLIRRVNDGEDPLVVWGDGTQIRDFIHVKDVVDGIKLVVEKGINYPVNIGSGIGYSIKELVDVIIDYSPKKQKIIWDYSKPTGDKKRVLDISKAKAIGFEPKISLNQGIKEVMQWYQENKGKL